jgi:hypothetical protein
MSNSDRSNTPRCLACGQRPRRPGFTTCSVKCAKKLTAFTEAKFANSFAKDRYR